MKEVRMSTTAEDNELYDDELEMFEQLIEQITVEHYDGPLLEAHGEYFPSPPHIDALLEELWGKLLTRHTLNAMYARLIEFGQPLSRWCKLSPDDASLKDDLHVD
jgi:hypothetical protein